MSTRLENKERFIQAVARYLVENQASKSIALEMESKIPPPIHAWAKEWADVRNAAPIFGYATVDETAEALRELL